MLLEVEDLRVHYGKIEAIRGISIEVDEGEIVTLIGANGAGKTTTLKTLSGLRRVSSGRVRFDGSDITGVAGHKRVLLGICQAPEGRGIFPGMTVLENLDMGTYARKSPDYDGDLDRVFTLFPRLAERRRQPGGTLSGGEQQMLAIGRCLMGAPDLVMFDEPSLGLAPTIVQFVLRTIRDLNREGLTCVLVEQNVAVSLKLASRAYVLENGRITLTGSGAALLADDRVRRAYLGL